MTSCAISDTNFAFLLVARFDQKPFVLSLVSTLPGILWNKRLFQVANIVGEQASQVIRHISTDFRQMQICAVSESRQGQGTLFFSLAFGSFPLLFNRR
jgi:hypothetical protein